MSTVGSRGRVNDGESRTNDEGAIDINYIVSLPAGGRRDWVDRRNHLPYQCDPTHCTPSELPVATLPRPSDQWSSQIGVCGVVECSGQ